MGAELGSLLFSSSIRFFQLVYLKKKKMMVCFLFVLCISPRTLTLLSDAVDGQSSSTCKSDVCCIYKCTVIAACLLQGGSPWKREEANRRGDTKNSDTSPCQAAARAGAMQGQPAGSVPWGAGLLVPGRCLSWNRSVIRMDLACFLPQAFSPSSPEHP